MSHFPSTRTLGTLTAALCTLLLASCGKKLPDPRPGTGPKYNLQLRAPATTLVTTEATSGTVQVKAGRQTVNIQLGAERLLEYKPVIALTTNTLKGGRCRIRKATFQYNNIIASSEDPDERKSLDPREILKYVPPEEQVRKTLGQELKVLTEITNLVLYCDEQLDRPELIDDMTSSDIEFTLLKDFAKQLEDPKEVRCAFIAYAHDILPNHPVAQGAVWHVDIQNEYIDGLSIPTAVTLERVTDRNGETIATLKTLGLLMIKKPMQIRPPNGELTQVNRCSIEIEGNITLNITRHLEERNSSMIDMSYRVQQMGEKADCTVSMSVNVSRKTAPSE